MSQSLSYQSRPREKETVTNDIYERIAAKILQVALDPRSDGVVKIKGTDNEYRILISDDRVRYEIDHDL